MNAKDKIVSRMHDVSEMSFKFIFFRARFLKRVEFRKYDVFAKL